MFQVRLLAFGMLAACVGSNYSGSISTSYATGAVIGSGAVGGLCGYNSSSISTSYATGAVSGNYSVGGLCGENNYEGSIIRSYWDKDTSGQEVSAGGWGLTTEQMKQAASYYGWTDGSWTIDEGNDYPHLAWENVSGTIINTDYPAKTYVGQGTQAEPYELAEATDILCLSYRDIDWGKSFVFVADIDLGGQVFNHPIIGNGNIVFSGRLDGAGHVVRNITIYAPTQRYVGFISRLSSGAVITDLGLENIEVTGDNYIGGLCGYNSGSISNSYATGVVTGYSYVGGLCGENYGSISNSYATGAVTGSWRVGGLCGRNYYGSISNSYATGAVTGSDSYVGGLCGYQFGDSAIIENCLWDIQKSGQTVGYNLDSSYPGTVNNVEGITSTEMQTQSTFTDFGWDFTGETANGTEDTWVIREGMSYPHLNFLSGSGTVESPFNINNANEIRYISQNNAYWDKYFKLMNDLNLNGVELTPIGNNEEIQVGTTTVTNSFSGSFDGNRHVIRNFKVSHKDSAGTTKLDDVGLFGLVSGQGAQIKQLGIEAVTIGLPDDRAGNNVGDLVGRLSGGAKVSECFVTDDSGAVRIFGTDNVGGLVGFVSDSGTVVENCYTLFNHSGTSEEQTRISSNNVTGNNATGGLAGGLSGGTLRNCYSDAYIATVLSGVSKGFIAGYVADDTGSQIELCYYDADREDEDSSINNNGESCDLGDIDGYYIYEDEEATVWDFVSNDDRYEELLLPLGLSDDGNYDLWYMYDNGSKKFPKFWWQHPERSDLNFDNMVDMFDFTIMADEWLADTPIQGRTRLLSDIDDENGVNLEDLEILLNDWLK